MKRVVFSISIFFLLTISTAFHSTKIDLPQPATLLDYPPHDHRIEPSSDGAHASNIIITPPESSPVPDHTESSPFEVIQEIDITPDSLTKVVDLGYLRPLNLLPIQQETGFNRYYFPSFRSNPHNCRYRYHRDHIRFSRNRALDRNYVDLSLIPEKGDGAHEEVVSHRHAARNFPEVEGDEVRMFDHFTGPHHMTPRHRLRHHRHRHHHRVYGNEEDQTVEIKTAFMEEEEKAEKKHEDHEHENRNNKKDLLNKIRKFLGYY